MYNFGKDLDNWRRYVLKIHARYIEKQDAYTFLQSVVERFGHELVASENRMKSRILEIGGGGGEHVRYELPLKDKKYIVIDINSDHLKLMMKQYNLPAIAADGAFLPFRSGLFESCVSIGVLEHICDLDRMLSEVNRVLKENGDFFVVVPTNGSLCINLFKLFISYPSMYINGIRKPRYIWNYENVNNFTRVQCMIEKFFYINRSEAVPVKFLPWFLSPLWFFHCKVK